MTSFELNRFRPGAGARTHTERHNINRRRFYGPDISSSFASWRDRAKTVQLLLHGWLFVQALMLMLMMVMATTTTTNNYTDWGAS